MCSFAERRIEFCSEEFSSDQDLHQFSQQNRQIKVYQENGSVYFGRIKQGKRHDWVNLEQSPAILLYDDFSLLYRGPFKDDMREGVGVVTSDGIQDEITRLRIPKVPV